MTPHPRRVAEACEWRDDGRSDADQAVGGVVHPNGTRIVSSDAAFLVACVRHLVAAIHDEKAA